jgi:hypothetical protein
MTENATTPVPPITRGEIAAAAILALTILAVLIVPASRDFVVAVTLTVGGLLVQLMTAIGGALIDTTVAIASWF